MTNGGHSISAKKVLPLQTYDLNSSISQHNPAMSRQCSLKSKFSQSWWRHFEIVASCIYAFVIATPSNRVHSLLHILGSFL